MGQNNYFDNIWATPSLFIFPNKLKISKTFAGEKLIGWLEFNDAGGLKVETGLPWSSLE